MSVFPAAVQPVPARLFYDGDRLSADWVDIADTDPTLPFLHDRIAQAGPSWRAPLPTASGTNLPSAVVLHAGRCGSTLVSRSLSRMSRCHVVSEPQAVNAVLGVDGIWPFKSHKARCEALRQVIAALTRSARPDQDRVILKLSSWNALHLPLIEEVLPDVPKLFVYRQPEEILVSLRDAPAGWMRRAADPVQTKLFLGGAAPTGRHALAFAAQVLGRIFAMVADAASRPGAAGRWLLIPYSELPGALNGKIPAWLGLHPSVVDLERIADAAAIHTKDANGKRPFEPDSARKRAAVTPELAELAARFVNAAHDYLDRLRVAGEVQ
ncbi:hypothetical protein K9B35_16470 [Sphingomonas sp. R647]|uniref:hypothetical protein n=1 Tax=Sphingomonas sp. R647 TaxID=2875233 RepID=UPI001CD5DD4C|nr:hypothetical protein [Sphingomonas sp. R647]MCA1199564.1 hypothetical protein [Sphingomonas sp. R647]